MTHHCNASMSWRILAKRGRMPGSSNYRAVNRGQEQVFHAVPHTWRNSCLQRHLWGSVAIYPRILLGIPKYLRDVVATWVQFNHLFAASTLHPAFLLSKLSHWLWLAVFLARPRQVIRLFTTSAGSLNTLGAKDAVYSDRSRRNESWTPRIWKLCAVTRLKLNSLYFSPSCKHDADHGPGGCNWYFSATVLWQKQCTDNWSSFVKQANKTGLAVCVLPVARQR